MMTTATKSDVATARNDLRHGVDELRQTLVDLRDDHPELLNDVDRGAIVRIIEDVTRQIDEANAALLDIYETVGE